MATPISPSVQDALQTLDARVELNLLEVLAKSYGEGFVKAVEGMEAKPQGKKEDSRLLKEDVARLTKPIQDYNKALAGKVDEIVRDSFAAGKDDMEVARILRARIPEILNNEPITIQRIGKRPVSFTADEYADIVANVVPYAVRNEGYIRGLKEAGADGWQWVAVGDERMCPMCGAKHGQIYGWDDAKPPGHPGCIVEGTEIESPDGIIAGTRSRYDGPVVKLLFASGRSLSVTPNHPVLTPNGFVSANLLREGDDVLCRPYFERVLEIDPDDNEEVTTVEKVFSALLESPGVVSRAMPVSPEDFHGDATFINGDVDIIWSDRLLRATGKSITFEPISEDLFCPGGADNQFLSGSCDFASFLKRAGSAFSRDMSSFSKCSNLFRAGLSHSKVHRLTAPSRNHPKFEEPVLDNVPRAGELLGEGFDGHATIIEVKNILGINFPSGGSIAFSGTDLYPGPTESCNDSLATAPDHLRNGITRLSRFIELDNIVSIQITACHGYVYDFQSISSLLLCNGILVSNCRCRPIAYFRKRTKEEIIESERIKAWAEEKPWETPGTPAESPDEVAEALIDDIIPKKMAYPGSKIERPKLERKTIDLHNSPVIQKATVDEIAYMNGASSSGVIEKGDSKLKALAEEIGFSDMPTIVSESELDKIVAEGHRELWRGLNQNKPGEFTNLFRSGEYFAGEGIYGNGIYTGTGEGARNLAALYAPGEHGAVMRMAIDKDAKVITVTELKEKLDAELKSLKFDRSSEEAWAASKVKKEFMQDPGRAAVVWGYDAIDVENGQFIVLNRKAIYVQATDYTREDRSKW